MDRFTDDTRFSEFTNDTYESRHTIDYSLENELRKTIQRQKKTIFSLAERNRVWKIVSAVLAVLLVIESILLWSNSADDSSKIPDASNVQSEHGQMAEQSSVHANVGYPVNEEEISRILSQMTLVDKIHQMMFVTPEELTGFEQVTAAGESTKASLVERKVGGIMYAPANIESVEQVKDMLSNTADYAVTPVFMGFERGSGTIAQDGEYTMQSLSVMATYADEAQAGTDYTECSKELASLGFNVNFALGGEHYSGIDGVLTSGLGTDAKAMSELVSIAVKGQLVNNVSSVLGLFPTDSSGRTAEQLRTTEFELYKAGIAAGADFVTVSHKANTAPDADGASYSMSRSVVADMLRGELGFDGVVVSAPLTQLEYTEDYTPGEAAIRCIKAGVNMLLCPVDLEQTVSDINEAVRVGELDVSLIDDSVRHILRIKQKRGIIK